MRFPRLLLLIGLLGFTLTFVQLGVISVAFEKLGLSRNSAFLLLLTTLFGSLVNLPLFTVSAAWSPAELPPPVQRIFRFDRPVFGGRTLVAVNVGGCVTPVAFSIFLLGHAPVPTFDVLLAVGLVAVVAHGFSRPLPGVGIGIPLFIAPLTAALVAVLLNPEQRAVLAYVGGTLGVLIGADLLRIGDIRRLGVPVASIGGAGTFDGIFITGIIAVLLA
jgi:uncharacterized membrane protein